MRRLAGMAMTAALLVAAAGAVAEEAALSPPQGARRLLGTVADGVQIYGCAAAGTGFAWAFKAPEAALFDGDGRQVGRHFAGPSWQLQDGSAITGEVVAKQDAPGGGAIPWLLLRVKTQDGQGGLAGAAFIQRVDTKGGLAPPSGCDAAHLGAEARMRYSACYLFYAAP